jgi:2-iminobutanoate/2-iminopropanoate deaminase
MTAEPTTTAATTPAPYSPLVRCPAGAELVFVSGQLPVTAGGQLADGGPAAQLAVALGNALEVARSAGAGPADVVKVTVYTTDLSSMDELNRAYTEVLGGARPARTTVEVSRLPRGALAEVDLVATVPTGR